MRVCHVTPHLPPEQAANAILPVQLGRALEGRGVAATFVSHPSTRGRPPDGVTNVTFAPRRGGGLVARTPIGAMAADRRMATAMRDAVVRADLVHLHSNGFVVEVAARLARRAMRPSVITLYGTDVWDHDPRRHGRFRAAVESARVRVFYSRALREFAVSLGLAGAPAEVIYAPVDDAFRRVDTTTRSAWRRELGVGDRLVVLTVKRLHRVAGYEDALEAIAPLAAAVPNLVWIIIGYGGLRDAIESAVRARGLDGRVRLLGLTPHEMLPRWYAAADVFLLPSRLESWGAVTLEALACGTPVVATATAGSREIHGLFPRDVMLVPVGDAGAIERAVAAALGAPRRASDESARLVDERFRVEAAATAYLDVYQRAITR